MMDIVERTGKYLTVRISDDELLAINNALNESREWLEDWEFPIRMGVSKEEVDALLAQIPRPTSNLTATRESAIYTSFNRIVENHVNWPLWAALVLVFLFVGAGAIGLFTNYLCVGM